MSKARPSTLQAIPGNHNSVRLVVVLDTHHRLDRIIRLQGMQSTAPIRLLARFVVEMHYHAPTNTVSLANVLDMCTPFRQEVELEGTLAVPNW